MAVAAEGRPVTGASAMHEVEVSRLTQLIFLPNDSSPADVALLFGCTGWPGCLEAGLSLYRSASVATLMISGGWNARLGANETRLMCDAALAAGVPACDLVLDGSSANTHDNAVNSYAALVTRFGAGGFGRVKLVAIQYHMLRAWLTARQVFPADVALSCASYPSVYYDERDWHRCERGRRDVASELEKIARYVGPLPADAAIPRGA